MSAKYKEIGRKLEAMIEEGSYGEGHRLPSEKELSDRLDVSYMTLRRAVGVLESDGLVRRVRGRGTFVVRGPKAPKQTNPGVVLVLPRAWERLDPYYFPDIVQGFWESCGAKGLSAFVAHTGLGGIPSKMPVAILLIERRDQQLAEELRDIGHPVVAVNRYRGRRNIPSIAPENRQGARAAIQRLVSMGHSRIAFVRGNPRNLDAEERQAGYRSAMREAGLDVLESGAGFSEEHGYLAAKELLGLSRPPTAMFTASDLAAIGAMTYAREAGIGVPTDLSIVGFGDFRIRTFVSPVLTTVELPRIELGRSIGDALHALSCGLEVTSATLKTKLIPGETDCAPKILHGSVMERRNSQ